MIALTLQFIDATPFLSKTVTFTGESMDEIESKVEGQFDSTSHLFVVGEFAMLTVANYDYQAKAFHSRLVV